MPLVGTEILSRPDENQYSTLTCWMKTKLIHNDDYLTVDKSVDDDNVTQIVKMTLPLLQNKLPKKVFK